MLKVEFVLYLILSECLFNIKSQTSTFNINKSSVARYIKKNNNGSSPIVIQTAVNNNSVVNLKSIINATNIQAITTNDQSTDLQGVSYTVDNGPESTTTPKPTTTAITTTTPTATAVPTTAVPSTVVPTTTTIPSTTEKVEVIEKRDIKSNQTGNDTTGSNSTGSSSKTKQTSNSAYADPALMDLVAKKASATNSTITVVSTRSANPEIKPNTTVPKPPKTNNITDLFKNEDFILVTANHGLHLLDNGFAYVFPDYYDHFFQVPIPILSSFQPILNETVCEEYVKNLIELLNRYTHRNNSDIHHDIEVRLCETGLGSYKTQIEDLNKILSQTQDKFQTRLQKRIIVTAIVVAAMGYAAVSVASAAAGYYWGNKHATDLFEREITTMKGNISVNREQIKLNSELLIGLSKHMDEITKDYQNKIELLSKSTRYQIQNLERSVMALAANITKSQILTEARLNVIEYLNTHLVSLQNILMLELNKVREWEEAITTLNTGRLPRNLISWNELKGVLNQIEAQLVKIYEFAIPNEDWPLYYTLQTYSYVVTKETDDEYTLYIHMKIPLRTVRTDSRYAIITPAAKPFPCIDSCLGQDDNNGQDLIAFDLPQTSYLIDEKTRQIVYEANLDHFTCQETARSRICYTFYPTLLQTPSSCTTNIYNWDEDNIAKYCRFRQASKEEYKVIPINFNRLLIHNNIIKQYYITCKGRSTNHTGTTQYAETIDIPMNCEAFFPDTMQKIFGPFAKTLRDDKSVTMTIRDDLTPKIRERYKNTTLKLPTASGLVSDVDDRNNLSRKSYEEFQINLNNDQLTKIAKFTLEAQQRLEEGLKKLENNVVSYTYRWTFWGFFALIGEFIQWLATLTVIFGILSYSGILGIFGMNVLVLEPRAVNAWEFQLIPDVKIFPDITVEVFEDTAAIGWLMAIAFVIIIIIALILCVIYGTFRQIRFSYHYGKAFPSTWGRTDEEFMPHTLMLNMAYRSNSFRYIKSECIYIKLPITCMGYGAIKEYRIKNPLNTWYIAKRYDVTGIALTDEVHIIGLDDSGERIEDGNEEIFIPISEINWNSKPKPEAVKRIGNNGTAMLAIVKKKFHLNWEDLTGPPQRRSVRPVRRPPQPLPVIMEIEEGDHYV